MGDASTLLFSKLQSWVDGFIVALPNIAIAIIVLVAFFFLSRYSKRFFTKLISKISKNEAVTRLMANILTICLVLLGIFLALGILGLDKTVTSLLAGAGILGLAVGLAFQDPILNVISGVIMSFKKPFNIGDTITSNGYNGEIVAITLRSTQVKTFTGEDIFIPNKMMLQNPLENYTLTRWRRVDIQCGVSYSDDLKKVEKVAVHAIESNLVYDTSKPVEFLYDEFGDSSINFSIRYWLNLAEESNYLRSKSEAIVAIKQAFDRNEISIPFPIRTVELKQIKPGFE